MFASKACSGPIPLRWAYCGLRGTGSALAEEALGRMGFRAVREGFLVFASKARSGPIPLRWAYCGGGEAFGVPQRGTAYQHGVKPRVWCTTGAF